MEGPLASQVVMQLCQTFMPCRAGLPPQLWICNHTSFITEGFCCRILALCFCGNHTCGSDNGVQQCLPHIAKLCGRLCAQSLWKDPPPACICGETGQLFNGSLGARRANSSRKQPLACGR